MKNYPNGSSVADFMFNIVYYEISWHGDFLTLARQIGGEDPDFVNMSGTFSTLRPVLKTVLNIEGNVNSRLRK